MPRNCAVNSSPRLVRTIQRDAVVVPLEVGDLGVEQRVVVEAELLADALAVLEDLGRVRVLLDRHVPGLFEQRHVDERRRVALRAGVAVPVPGAAEVAALLDDAHVVDARPPSSRAPVTSPAKPPPMNATVTWSVQRLALDDRRVRVVEVVRRAGPSSSEVLLVAVGPQALVALLARTSACSASLSIVVIRLPCRLPADRPQILTRRSSRGQAEWRAGLVDPSVGRRGYSAGSPAWLGRGPLVRGIRQRFTAAAGLAAAVTLAAAGLVAGAPAAGAAVVLDVTATPSAGLRDGDQVVPHRVEPGRRQPDRRRPVRRVGPRCRGPVRGPLRAVHVQPAEPTPRRPGDHHGGGDVHRQRAARAGPLWGRSGRLRDVRQARTRAASASSRSTSWPARWSWPRTR